ncbi:MAG: DUF151 domain-containing protein [Flavobacteriaceae bacterium]|nr:DUF151 domain-containing protein [Flavobacteriaceae bacterium]
MDLVKLVVEGIYSEFQASAFLMILAEEDGDKQMPVVIGGFEAQSIALSLEEKIKPPRPLSHDLFKVFSDSFEIKVSKVVITDLKEGVFFASLHCQQGKTEKVIDARTSDAVAIALRFKAPIYASKSVLKNAGTTNIKINLTIKETPKETDWKKIMIDEKLTKEEIAQILQALTENELDEALHHVVKLEKYEIAAHIRDEINIRQSSKS